jgi:hypothetical protein
MFGIRQAFAKKESELGVSKNLFRGMTMQSQILKDYFFHLLPAVLVPLLIHAFDDSIPAVSLLKIGLMFPLVSLAMKGLAGFFPPENLKHRSLARMAEYAVLQGLVFAAFIVMIDGWLIPAQQSSLLAALRQFGIAALVMSAMNIWVARRAQKRLRG